MGEPHADAFAGPPTLDLEGPAPTVMERLPSGTLLGRYILTGALGEGGAGVVYAAYDPELDRKLAIKLVRPLARTQARLLREAQRMARLSHPNVVVVHDVGTYGDRIFMAMELVDGGTLREWLREKSRSSRAVLEIFAAAGRGLAAAHAAGFVHLDFKPDNTLIGRDGTVRVTDFGLARTASASPDDEPETDPDAGGVTGTPGYMAPERYASAPPDPRSDQFALCAALYEALHGRLPFDGDTEAEVRAATLLGKLPLPERSSRLRVSAHIDRAISRGLSVDPDDRFPSISDLLTELTRDPAARIRRLAAIAGGVCAVVALAWGTRATIAHHEQLCRGADAHLAGVWDGPRRDRAHAAFLATQLPYADAAFQRAAAELDRFASDWVAMRTEACEATHVRGEQSEQVLTLRMGCLDGRLRELGSFVQIMDVAGGDLVQAAVQAAGKLSPVSTCGDVAALTAPLAPPANAPLRAAVEALRGRLADARGRASAGKFVEAAAADLALVDEARRTGYSPLVAEALVDLGAAQAAAGRYEEAERTLCDADDEADESHHDEARGRALLALAEVTGRWLGHYALAARYATSAVHVAHRIGDARLESFALETASREHGYVEELDRALDEARQSIALTERLFEPDDLRRARVHASLSIALAELGRFDESEQNDRLALSIAERALGPSHPDLCNYLDDLGLDLVWSGRAVEAIPLLQRACEIGLHELGPEHPRYAGDLNNLAYAENELGHFARGLELDAQALAIFERSFGPDHGESAYALVGMGEALLGLGDPARALPLLVRATRLAEANGLEAETLGDCHFYYGLALSQTKGDPALARELVGRAVTEYGKAPRLLTRKRKAEDWLASHAAPTH